MRRPSLLALSLLVAACSSGASTGGLAGDAGTDAQGTDARTPRADAAPRDASDAATPKDAGHDAPVVDTGVLEASSPDASTPDGAAHDAATPDAASDAQPSDASDAHGSDASDANAVDAGTDTGAPGTCGGATCYVGQSCVAGACEFTGCVGSHVPGDYATVTAALTALAQTGGTICLGAQTYDETATVQAQGSATPITIQGVGPGLTILTGFATSFPSMTFSLQGLTLHSVFAHNPGSSAPGVPDTLTLAITEATVDGVGAAQPSVDVDTIASTIDLTLDGVDLSAGGMQTALSATMNYGGTLKLSVTNSYVHGANVGVGITQGEVGQDDTYVAASFINDTFVGNGTAIDDTLTDVEIDDFVSLTAENDLFVNSTLALDTGSGATFGTNDLYGNVSNYAGTASAGTGTLEVNPLLDTATPPGLLAGSPCRGAADATVAPAHDFFGRPRGTLVDIGAVQSSP